MHTDPEVLALVALGEQGAATPEDLEHIAHCTVCGHEITELGHLAGVGRTISDHFTLETPSPEVWDRIRAELGIGHDFSSPLIPPPADRNVEPGLPRAASLHLVPDADRADDRPESARTGATRTDAPGRRRSGRLVSLALAAVLALIVGVGGTLAWQQLRADNRTVLWTAPLSALPDWSGSIGEAKVEEGADGQRWLVVDLTTPRPVDGIRQVWLMDREADAMVPVGQLTGSSGVWTLDVAIDVDRFPVVDVSDEPPDGQVTHSGESIVRGTLDV